MRRRVAWCSLALLAFAGGRAYAQQSPTTVQLPTFSVFSGSTTVVVPDGGSVYMGGVTRAASGRSEAGVPMLPLRPFRNTAIGQERSVSSLRVSATIHDFEAMDEYLLSRPTDFSGRQLFGRQQVIAQQVIAGQRTPQPWPAAWPASRVANVEPPNPRIGSSWNPAAPQGEVPTEGQVAQIQAQSRARQAAGAAEAVDFFERGQTAEQSGKLGVAKVYYRMAARQADEQLAPQVAARLARIAQAETGPQVAQNGP